MPTLFDKLITEEQENYDDKRMRTAVNHFNTVCFAANVARGLAERGIECRLRLRGGPGACIDISVPTAVGCVRDETVTVSSMTADGAGIGTGIYGMPMSGQLEEFTSSVADVITALMRKAARAVVADGVTPEKTRGTPW